MCVCVCVCVYTQPSTILSVLALCSWAYGFAADFSEKAIGCLGTLQAGLECLPETRQKSQGWSWAGHADPLILVQGLYTAVNAQKMTVSWL